jgi:hypothetical protein
MMERRTQVKIDLTTKEGLRFPIPWLIEINSQSTYTLYFDGFEISTTIDYLEYLINGMKKMKKDGSFL